MAGASPKYPDDCIQSYIGTWWVEDDTPQLARGRLVWAFVPHVDQQPFTLTPVGRAEPTSHDKVTVKIEPLRARADRPAPQLPIAALPLVQNEVRTVYRAKRRPVVVLSTGGPDVDPRLRPGTSRWQSAPTALVAPFYGADPGATRGGWRPEFVQRIRRCEYPQYVWDKLPLSGATESILRLDHLQPIGRHHDSFDMTPYRLSGDALNILDDWLQWLLTEKLSTDAILREVREALLGLPGA